MDATKLETLYSAWELNRERTQARWDAYEAKPTAQLLGAFTHDRAFEIASFRNLIRALFRDLADGQKDVAEHGRKGQP